MLTKNKRKRKKLIRKLFLAYCKELGLTDIKLRIIDNFRNQGTTCSYSYKGDLDIIITLDIMDIASYCFIGCNNDYYPNRAETVNKFILHNKHNTIRWAMLHEIKHAYDLFNDKNYRSDIILIDREQKADDYALAVIKNENKNKGGGESWLDSKGNILRSE